MLYKTTVIFLLIFHILGFSQNTKIAILDSIIIQADVYVGKDMLGFDYYVKNNGLYKQKLTEKWEYKNLSLGEITSIDIINPLKTVVFYKDFNHAVLLDNQLSEITKINLSDHNIMGITCSMASGNRLWVYDDLSNNLLLLDYLNKKITTINQPFKNTFRYYNSDYNNWYRITQDHQIYAYDNYGRMTDLGQAPAFDYLLLIQNQNMLFSLHDNLYLYGVTENTVELLLSKIKNLKNFNYANGILTVFSGESLKNYTLKLP